MNVKELADRYGLKSTKAVYDRLAALEITLPKKNRKSFATEEIVEKLDKLQIHLDQGGSLKNFDENVIATDYHVVESESTSLDVIESGNAPQQVIYVEREFDPLMPNRLLTEAAEQGYILTSKQIHDILGTKPRGSTFTRLGFVFTKLGREGVYSSWSVEKI